MTIALFDIVQARLEAMAYERVASSLRNQEADKRGQQLAQIADECARRAGFALKDLRGKARTREVVRARQSYMLAARQAGFSLAEIGRFVGRDHTTVLHGIAAAEARQ